MSNIQSRPQTGIYAADATARRFKYIITNMLVLALWAAFSVLIDPVSVSAQPEAILEASAFDPHEQVGHTSSHSQEGHADNGATAGQVLFYSVRAVYYFMLLLASGLMFWTLAMPEGKGGEARGLAGKWGLLAMRALLLVVIVYVFVHMNSLLKGYDGDSRTEWLRLLTDTSTGRSWLGALLLALLGFAALRLPDPLKAVWAMLLLAAESFNGHVNALPSNTLAVLLDFVHLVCGALWAGGVMLLLLFWRADRKEAGRFAEKFARAAWMTIVLLTASGIGMTALLLPSWMYLFYTGWGLLLLAKAALLILVMGTGFFLHRRARRGELPNGKLLKLDGILMGAVIILVGLLTYVSPVPDTQPLSYHQMGDKLHYTLQIKPNGPGPNQVKLKVWLPEQLGSPASVHLKLRPARNPQQDAVEVRLLSDYADDDLVFPGFKETDYYADKVRLIKVGEWMAELVIIDKAGGETRQTITFRND